MKRNLFIIIALFISAATFAEIPSSVWNEFWNEYHRIEYSNRKSYGDYNSYGPGHSAEINNIIKQTEQVYFIGEIKNDTVWFTKNGNTLVSEPIVDWYRSERAAKNDIATSKKNVENKNTFVIGTNKRCLKVTKIENSNMLQLERI